MINRMLQDELKEITDSASLGDEWGDLYQHAREGYCL